MFDDLAAYYHEDVVTAFTEYRDTSADGVAGRSRDLRGALIAATALFHLREHLPTSALTRAEVEKRCPDYALLGDVVNVAKHKSVTNRTPHGPPLVNDAAQLGEQIVITEYEDEAGVYRHVQKLVVVKISDGKERNLLDVLTNVINFWEQHLHELGVLPKARTFAHTNSLCARTRAECKANSLNLEIVKGQRFRICFSLRRFNSKTETAEPIDLTGSDFIFRAYRPRYEIELSLKHEESGKEFKRSVTLSKDESEVFARLASDSERQAYVYSLAVAQEALHQLVVEAGLVKGNDAQISAPGNEAT